MDRDQAVEAVIRAIRDEGPQPAYHREIMARHRKEWPTLWKALEVLTASPPTMFCIDARRSDDAHPQHVWKANGADRLCPGVG